MNTSNHLSPEDLTLFALQSLPDEEKKNAIDHLEHCEACRHEIGEIQGDLVAYAMTAEMASPPALARERLMRRVGKEKKLVPVERTPAAEPALGTRGGQLFTMDTPEPVIIRKSSPLAWAGWAVAAGLAVACGLQFHQRQLAESNLNTTNAKLNQVKADSDKTKMVMDALTSSGAFQVAMHPAAPAGTPATPKKPEAHAAYDADKGALVFMATNLDSLQAYKTYELWVLPVTGAPIPAGIFKPDANGNASVVMPEIPRGVAAKGFGVTVEDEGGTKAPTMSAIVLVGL